MKLFETFEEFLNSRINENQNQDFYKNLLKEVKITEFLKVLDSYMELFKPNLNMADQLKLISNKIDLKKVAISAGGYMKLIKSDIESGVSFPQKPKDIKADYQELLSNDINHLVKLNQIANGDAKFYKLVEKELLQAEGKEAAIIKVFAHALTRSNDGYDRNLTMQKYVLNILKAIGERNGNYYPIAAKRGKQDDESTKRMREFIADLSSKI